MENASKALVIAGGVLLSIIIISVVVFAYRGITSLQDEKDISLSNEQISKINEQIEKYTKKSTIYGSEVLSICNAIEDYSNKYPESEGYSKIIFTLTISEENTEDSITHFELSYNNAGKLVADYTQNKGKKEDFGKESLSNGKTIEELYNYLKIPDDDALEQYLELYGITDSEDDIMKNLQNYEEYKNSIETFTRKEFKANVDYSDNTGIIEKVEITYK